MRKVHVNAGKGYDVHIGKGMLDSAGAVIAGIHKPCRIAVIADERVWGICGDRLKKSIEDADFSALVYTFPSGEASKSTATLIDIQEFLAENELTRGDMIVALGGGVAGDMAGFAAATYLRGIPYVGVPTTLLSAVDSSVGGKTAVNLKAGKNLFGAFWQPSAVVCDTEIVSALPDALLTEGAAEALKAGVIVDEELFSLMKSGNIRENIEEIICRSVEIKAEVVESDLLDLGRRQLLNLGHTPAHAIEKLSELKISHGCAVAMGMVIMARAAEKLGIARAGVAEAISEGVRAIGADTECPFTVSEMAKAAAVDKKRSGESLNVVLPERIGSCILKKIPVEELEELFGMGLEA